MGTRHIGVALVLSVVAAPLPSWSAHYLGHGLATQPPQQQIDQFCNKQYPEISQSPQYSAEQKQQAEKLYKQHCVKQPAPKPVKPAQPALPDKPEAVAGRIDRIEGPSCVKQGSEIRVRGGDLRRGDLTCRLESKGQRRALSAYSRTEQEYRFRLNELLAGPELNVACEVAGDREGIRLQACRAAAEQADGTDLVPEISAGALRPGEIQTVEVSVLNRGRSQPGNQRHRLVLVLADRDLSRTGLRTMSSALSPAAGEILAHKRQWVMRVPGSGGSEHVPVAMTVPARLPDGETLYWCAYADSDDGIPEVNERNNLECAPASGGGGIVARKDLSGVFGSAVRKPGVDAQVDPGALKGAALPAGARLASLDMTLKVNSSYGMLPVDVDPDGPMTVSWDALPEQVAGDPVTGLHLRFREGSPFPANDCAGGPSSWDDGGTDGYFAGSGSSAGSYVVDDARRSTMAAGRSYFVKGCVMVNDGTLDAVAVDDPDGETNPVEVNYGGEPDWVESLVRFAASDASYPRVLWESTSAEITGVDLEVYDLMHAPGGPNRNRILILVRAADFPGDIDPSATVPLELRVLGLPDSREGRQGEVVWSRTVRIADFQETRLKSYWSDYRLPVGRRAVVRATVGEPPFAGDPIPGNNVLVRDVGAPSSDGYVVAGGIGGDGENLEMENLILQVVEERGGDDWGMFRIDYSTSRGDAALTFDMLYEWGMVPGADCIDMAGGRSPLAVMNGSLAPGRNQSVRVMCVARDASGIPGNKFGPDGRVPLKLYAVLIPEYLPGSSMFRPWELPPDMSGAAPDARTREAEAQRRRIREESGLTDLVVESVELEYGTASGDLGPKFLHVTVANRGVSASAATEVRASFYGERNSGASVFVTDVDMRVVSVAPGRSLRLTTSVRRSPELVWGCLSACTVPESTEFRGGRIDVMVDAKGAILESDETNNRRSLRETRDYPASLAGG